MFANVGWGEMLVLVIAGLVILGPERPARRHPLDVGRTGGRPATTSAAATSQLREDLWPGVRGSARAAERAQQAAWHDTAGRAHLNIYSTAMILIFTRAEARRAGR